MTKTISKDPSVFLRVKVEIPEPIKDITFTVPAALKAGALKALDDIRALFGPSGQYWTTDEEHEKYAVGDEHPDTGKILTKELNRYCLIGGVRAIDGAYEGIARAAIALAILDYTKGRSERLDNVYDEDEGESLQDDLLGNGHITTWNDDDATWKDVKAVLKLAKKLVTEAAVK